MNKKILFLIFILLIVSGSGYLLYKNTERPADGDELQVIASFYPLYFFTSVIGGDKVNVTNLTPSGSEPHEYEPTVQDIAKIESSALLVLNGGNLEVWAEDIKPELTSKNVMVVTAGEELIDREVVEDGEMIRDPHIWLSPRLAKVEVINITNALIKIDPSNKDYYDSNSRSLIMRLEALDTAYSEGLRTCASKDIITAHEAFGYLADNYGLKQVTITGISPDEEPSTKKLTELTDFIRRNNIKYIFFESLVSPKLAETLAQETGAQTLILDTVEGISEEDMEAGKDYFTQMEMNLANLKLALQCQ